MDNSTKIQENIHTIPYYLTTKISSLSIFFLTHSKEKLL